MATGHVHALYRHGTSVVHRLPPQAKLLGAFLFVIAVVATPQEAFWAFGCYLVVLLGLFAVAGLSPKFVATRLLIEIPFVIVAVLLPFLSGGEQVVVLGVSMSKAGLWAMWNIVAKATLGLLTSVLLAGTTQVTEILTGLDALRVPKVVTSIMGFMVRYLDVVLGEFTRMRVAMQARAFAPTWIGHAKPYAFTAGTMFVRSYERGERVYLAMASRGYTGAMPPTERQKASTTAWLAALSIPALAWLVVMLAWGLR